MPRFKLISLTTPLPGREEEFNDWYQNTHLPELLSFAELHGAQRYKRVAAMMGNDPNPYLAIYDLECDDPMTFLAAMGEAAASGKLTQSDTADMAVNYTALFSEFGQRVEKP